MVERKITSRHGVDSRPLSEWLKDAWHAAAGVRRFPLRRLAGAELSATAKRCSRAYPPGRRVLQVVIEIIALPANSTAITLAAASAVVRPRRAPRRNQNCEYSHDPRASLDSLPLNSRSPTGSMLRERNARLSP